MTEQRADLPLDHLVTTFLEETTHEEPRLAKDLALLDDAGRRELAGILGRFDSRSKGVLDARQRLLARRILIRLRKPSSEGLVQTNKILDYLDLNANALLEESELEHCVEILELFAHADSDNSTLSELELRMLYAVLRHIDSNDNLRLDAPERQQLREALEDPRGFLQLHRATNPLLQAVLSSRG